MDSKISNPVCITCKRELTDQETLDKRKECWYCIAETYSRLKWDGNIPPPETWGRPGAKLTDVVQQSKLAAITTPSSSGTVAPNMSSDITWTEEERKSYMTKFGVDPAGNVPVTVITVKNSSNGDDAYMQFSVRGVVAEEYKKEFERIMRNMLNTFGSVLAFGPNFGIILDNLRLSKSDQFLQ